MRVPPYTPPPATVSPEERATFGRAPGAGAFAPQPGERLPPRHTPPPPVPQVLTEAFASTPSAQGGFDPAPGTRIPPAGTAPGSPWWKADAQRDPWRDPAASYWLGRGAIFSAGQPEQVLPDDDVEYQDVEPADEAAADDEPKGGKFTSLNHDQKVYYHKLGTPQAEDVLTIGELEQLDVGPLEPAAE